MFAVDSHIRGQLRTPPDGALAELAGRQYGVVARRQLLALGLTRDQIDGRLAAGRLHLLHRGVYAVGHRVVERRGHWVAAVLACGSQAVLSHRDAAALWGIRETARTAVDVSVPRRGHRRPGITLHRATLAPQDTTTLDRIPTTSLARTLLDLASVVRHDAVVRALEEADRRRVIDTGPIHALLHRVNGHPGAPKLAAALRAYDPQSARTRSELERRFLALVTDAGLPRPTVNTLVEGYEVDALWPEQKLIVELDGYAPHRTRGAFERDRKRDAALLAAGLHTLRVTARRLDDEPAAILAELGVLLCVKAV